MPVARPGCTRKVNAKHRLLAFEAVLLHSVAQRHATDAELTRGFRYISARGEEGMIDQQALGAVQRESLQRVLMLGPLNLRGRQAQRCFSDIFAVTKQYGSLN